MLAYTVRQRVREIGIRLALGAPVKGVLGMVVVEGLKPTLVGVGLGLVLAAALVRVMDDAALRRQPARSAARSAAVALDDAGGRHRRDARAGVSRDPRRSDRHAAIGMTRGALT